MKSSNSTQKKWRGFFLTAAVTLFILFFNVGYASAQNVAINTDGSKADPNAIVVCVKGRTSVNE